MEIPEITLQVEKKITAVLSPKRYAHCKSTAEMAVTLAGRFEVDRQSAYLAGLSHDMCRELSSEEQEEIVKRYGACLDFLRGRPSLEAILSDRDYRKKMIHGPAAACELCHEFKMNTPVIIEAVALHSVADTEMSDLAKIIYISDKLEPLRHRPQDAGENLRTLDLDSLFVYTIACVVHWFSEAGKQLSPFTADLYSRMLK